MAEIPELPQMLLARARSGDASTRGQLLNSYRNYLRLLARTQMGQGLRLQIEPSDIVQETLLEADRDFATFAGGSEHELLAWLRRILVRNLLDAARRHQAQARDWNRQESLEALLEESSNALGRALLAEGATPSSQAAGREQCVLLADALERLPPDYRAVLEMRIVDQLPFEDIAARLGRSSGAVRMLWVRGVEKLSQEMGVSQ